MANKIDITAKVHPDLRAEAERRGARLFRLELGTVMLRHPQTLDTSFFHDETDALAVLRDGKPPAKRSRP